MVFINQEPRYSRTDGERGFVFCAMGTTRDKHFIPH